MDPLDLPGYGQRYRRVTEMLLTPRPRPLLHEHRNMQAIWAIASCEVLQRIGLKVDIRRDWT